MERCADEHFQEGSVELQIPPLRYAPVGMTLFLQRTARTGGSQIQDSFRSLSWASKLDYVRRFSLTSTKCFV
jgi:hypothetical protein